MSCPPFQTNLAEVLACICLLQHSFVVFYMSGMSCGLDEMSICYPPTLSGSKSRVQEVIKLGLFAADRYVTTHPQYADSASYAARFRQLQSRAMSTIRAKTNQILRHAAEQVTLLLRLPVA